MQNDQFWDNHYARFNDQAPSFFCLHCMERFLRKHDTLFEIGCGNGRDGLELARVVERYVGLDTCSKAVGLFRGAIEQSQPPRTNLSVEVADGTQFALQRFNGGRMAIYSRFSLHSIDYPSESRLLDNLHRLSRQDWICMIEARTIFDELYGVGTAVGKHEFVTDHYRRFIDPQEFIAQLIARFKLHYFEVSRGFAMYKGDDPLVMRVVFGGSDS